MQTPTRLSVPAVCDEYARGLRDRVATMTWPETVDELVRDSTFNLRRALNAEDKLGRLRDLARSRVRDFRSDSALCEDILSLAGPD